MRLISTITPIPKKFKYRDIKTLCRHHLIAEPFALLTHSNKDALTLIENKFEEAVGVFIEYGIDHQVYEIHETLWVITIQKIENLSLYHYLLPTLKTLSNHYKAIEERNYINLKLTRATKDRSSMNKDYKKITSYLSKQLEALTKTKNLLKQRSTELENTNMKLLSAKQEAERTSEDKSLFLAIMSHELRTPLNAVIGLLELLDQSNLIEEQISTLKTVQKSAHLLLNIVNDILDFSKIEAGKLKLEKRPLSIRKLVEEVVTSLKQMANQKSIQINYKIDQNIPDTLLGDEIRILQILYNLCNNAIKFTNPKLRQQGLINIDAKLHGKNSNIVKINIVIKDNGIGIPEHLQKKLFKPFLQADVSISRQYGGTGLGLAICKKLLSLMKGDITCKSKINIGTEFTCTVPLEIAPKKTVIQKNIEKKENLEIPESIKIKKVLIAEDNMINQMLFDKQLKKLGVNAILTNDGLSALNYWQSHPIDMIFTDCQMPIMNGYEMTKKIRKIEIEQKKNKIPIIAVTANVVQSELDRCTEAQMDECLTKPINLQKLKSILIKYCG